MGFQNLAQADDLRGRGATALRHDRPPCRCGCCTWPAAYPPVCSCSATGRCAAGWNDSPPGSPVRFLGHVADRRCLPHLLGAEDVTIAPAPMETFGRGVLESMACGTSVVVPAAGAARELVGPPGAGVVTSGTAFGLADGVEFLLALPASHRRAAARARAEQFPWTSTVAGMLALHGAARDAHSRP